MVWFMKTPAIENRVWLDDLSHVTRKKCKHEPRATGRDPVELKGVKVCSIDFWPLSFRMLFHGSLESVCCVQILVWISIGQASIGGQDDWGFVFVLM